MAKLTGTTAFITGGAQGIGLGIARAFAGEGMSLALADLSTEALARAEAELSAHTRVATSVGANSLGAAPREAVSAAARERVRRTAEAGDAALTRYGHHIDTVGQMVVAGIRADRLYIPTDRLAADAVTQRAAALLDAMPSGQSGHDNALATAMRQRHGNP